MIFEAKVALVTGGGSGIGRATAIAFAREGAKVVVSGRRQEPLDETVRLIVGAGGEGIAVAGDIAVEADVEEMVATAVERFGGLDVAVNNAGHEVALAKIADLSVDDFDATLALNVRGTFLCLKHEIKAMGKRGGAIVNVSSVNAVKAEPTAAGYCASKAALESLTRTAALEVAPVIRVNALRPGYVLTPMHSRALEHEGGETPELIEELHGMVPMRRRGEPEEAARSILWLCSDEAGYVTGSVLTMDGGLTAAG